MINTILFRRLMYILSTNVYAIMCIYLLLFYLQTRLTFRIYFDYLSCESKLKFIYFILQKNKTICV